MIGLMRKATSAVLVFGLTWAGTIAYWRQSGSNPSGLEILAMLGLLPAGLLGGGWMLRTLAARAAERAAARVADAADQNKSEAAAVEVDAAAPAASGLAVLSAAVRLPDAAEPSVLLSRPMSARRPGLHPQLKDHNGLPVMAGFAADLAEPVLPEQETTVAPRFLRVLALLEPVLDELAAHAAQALPALPAAEERVIAGWRQQRALPVECVLAVECLVDADMPASLRSHLQARLSQRLQADVMDTRRYSVEVLPMRDAGQVWERLAGLAESAATAPRWHLLLAASSTIDPGVIERWQSQGRLYRSNQSDGRVPGEAAAGVLLANAAAMQGQPHAWLQPPRHAQVDAAATVLQRSRLGAQLANDILGASAVDPQAVGFVISDAGVQDELSTETGQVARTVCPELDIASQCLPLAVSTGMLEFGSPLATLALAHARLQQSGEAVLLLGTDPPDSRWAALLHPSPLPEPHAQPDTAAAA